MLHFLPSFSSCFIVTRTINPYLFFSNFWASSCYNMHTISSNASLVIVLFETISLWNVFAYQLYTTCACKGMCGGPSKPKASLTLIQLVNMKQLFLQQYNVMLILNYMVLIIFIYSNYLSMVVQEIILAKKVGGHQLAPNDIKSLTFVSFFPMKEIYSLFTHISWYKGEFAKEKSKI